MRGLIIKYLIIILALFCHYTVFAQEIPTPFQKKDVQKLEKMVLNMYKKATHQRVDGVHVVNVFDVTCNNCDKRETYADTSFVKKLEYGYVKIGCRKYLPSVSLVCDIDNNVVGEWHWNSYSDHAVLYDQSFIDTLYSRHIVHVYRMCKGIETPFLIGVSGDCETYLIDSREYGYKVYPIAECLDLQWNYIIEGHPKLEIDNSPVP